MNYMKLVRDYEDLSCKRNLEGEAAKLAVRECGSNLRYVVTQTDEICKLAVKQDVNALQYVNPDIIELWSQRAYHNCDGQIIELGGKRYRLHEMG